MPQPYAGKVASLRQLAGGLTAEITLLEQVIADLLAGHEGYAAIQAAAGHRPGAGRGHRRRDRRHPPVPRPRAAGLAGPG